MITNQKTKKPSYAEEVLKVTALQYLKSALINEDYERCAELIGAAKEIGASAAQVRAVLKEYVRKNQKGVFKSVGRKTTPRF